ncbi:helix-turn-helix domain-containing protein [Candidatus Palauibacter sp.]|uniref:helix-turn-helix domain-containing protein n=1 Tax=Candidatus Palauibacter sp. TaxID=3101350 RepID=UPI003B52ED52
MLLRHYLDEGLTVTEISRGLGISRQTIYRWINDGELDRDLEEVRYGPRPPVPTKLDPYKAIVRERLEEYPELTALRLLAEIRAAGHPGGYTQFREYVREGAAPPSGRPYRAVRDGWGRAGPDRLRPLPLPVGPPLRASWSCSATRGCCGSGSTGGRTCRRCSGVWRRPSASSAACRGSCCSIR